MLFEIWKLKDIEKRDQKLNSNYDNYRNESKM